MTNPKPRESNVTFSDLHTTEVVPMIEKSAYDSLMAKKEMWKKDFIETKAQADQLAEALELIPLDGMLGKIKFKVQNALANYRGTDIATKEKE